MRCPSIPFFAAILLTLAGPARADVTLDLTAGNGALEDDLRAAARLLDLEDPASQPAQDVIAAARADYARLLAVLYEAGYFGPDVSIRLDGREADGISPFDAPGTIRDVAIRVAPGRPFRLGVAEIGPLAPRTDLPEGFASGAPAGTRVLRQAAEAGIAEWRNEGHATASVAGQRITARHDAAELDAEITLAPGPVATFGALTPQGQERMREAAIRRIAGLPVGARFDPETLDRVAARCATAARSPRSGWSRSRSPLMPACRSAPTGRGAAAPAWVRGAAFFLRRRDAQRLLAAPQPFRRRGAAALRRGNRRHRGRGWRHRRHRLGDLHHPRRADAGHAAELRRRARTS